MQFTQSRMQIVQEYAVDLDVLPGGHVQHAVAVPPRDRRQRTQLVQQNSPRGAARPQHVRVRLALFVHAAGDAERAVFRR